MPTSLDPSAYPQLAAAAAVQDACRAHGWQVCLVGGLAAQRWGVTRPTEDVDLLVETAYGNEGAVADALFARFAPRGGEARAFALRNRIVQIWAPDGVAVDVALSTSRRLHRSMARASWWEIAGYRLLTCSAEDLIVNKALAGRDRDWRDLASVIDLQGDGLDRDLVMREFGPARVERHQLGDPLAWVERHQPGEPLTDQSDGAAVDRLRKLLDAGGYGSDLTGRLVAAAAQAQRVCREYGWNSCVSGGVAVWRWGRPRPTKDVDILVETGYSDWARAAERLLDRFEPRFPGSRQLAVQSRVVQFWAPNGIAVDVALGTSRRLHRIMTRTSAWQVEGATVWTFSAEDLVVHKVLCGRESDWRDAEGVVARHGDALDRELILRELLPMLEHGGLHLGDPLGQLQRQDGAAAADRLQRLLDVATTAPL